MAIILGKEVTDSITGIKGIATARAEFLYGCVRIIVQPTKLVDGQRAKVEAIDELQLLENDPATTPPPHPVLGTVCKDSITGFKGVAVVRSTYLHAAPRIGLQPKELGRDGLPLDLIDFDEPQLLYKAAKKMEALAAPPAAATTALARTGGPGIMARAHSIARR